MAGALMGLLAGCQPTSQQAAEAPTIGTAAPHGGAIDSRMASELERAADRANVCSAREAKAAGLTAEYFGAPNLAGTPLLARQEGPLDLDWPSMGKDVPKAVRSARWRGWIRPPYSGNFSFHTDLPGSRITVAGKTLTDADGKVELHTGRYHPILIELRELPALPTGQSQLPPLELSWTTPFGARFLLPRAVLFPPSDTVDGAAAGAKPVAVKR